MSESSGIFSGLRVKITLYILIGALVLSALIISVTSYYLNTTLTGSLISQGRIIASSISELAAERLIEQDVIGLKNIVEKYRYYLSNEYIIIVDPDLNIVTDTYNGNLPEELQNKSDVRLVAEEATEADFSSALMHIGSEEVFDIQVPIKAGLLGFVRVGLRKSFIDSQVRSTLWYIGFIIAVGTLVAIAVALLLITLQVTRPVIHLAAAAEQISLGNFDTPVEVKVTNELQILGAAIDRMRESLKTSIERLKTRSTIGRF